MEEFAKYLRAITYLQLKQLHPEELPKSEILLAKAGLSHAEIADIFGKTKAAVQKSISRGKAS